MFSYTLGKLRSFFSRDEGVTSIEYGLIAGLVAVATIGSLVANGDSLTNTFDSVQSGLYSGNTSGKEGGAAGSGTADTADAGDPGGTTGDSNTSNTNDPYTPPPDGIDPSADSTTSITQVP